MRLLPLTLLLTPLALAHDWAASSASARDGVVQLDTSSYEALTSPSRDYGVTVVLTAMPQQFKCAPCHDFDPIFRTVARSWRKKAPKEVRDAHVFAELDFSTGQEVFQRLGLTSAPTVYYFPPAAGERKAEKTGAVNFDLNRARSGLDNAIEAGRPWTVQWSVACLHPHKLGFYLVKPHTSLRSVSSLTASGLSLPALHNWVRTTTPVPFDIYRPTNPVPFILAPLIIGTFLYAAYAARAVLIPVLSSRIVWGVGCTVLSILFTSGYMWNKIKNAPYVQMAPDGRVSWIAGGYSNQLGLESQVVGTLYGVLALTVVVLSVFIPAQSSPMKQRIGTYLWLVLMIVLYSLLIRLFKLKNGGYPFGLL